MKIKEMPMPKKNPLTPEIIISTLKHSSLNTVLIEGKDDLQVYNLMEKNIDNALISFLPCGGRNTLLKVLEEKDR